jgi:hypothetical protein
MDYHHHARLRVIRREELATNGPMRIPVPLNRVSKTNEPALFFAFAHRS